MNPEELGRAIDALMRNGATQSDIDEFVMANRSREDDIPLMGKAARGVGRLLTRGGKEAATRPGEVASEVAAAPLAAAGRMVTTYGEGVGRLAGGAARMMEKSPTRGPISQHILKPLASKVAPLADRFADAMRGRREDITSVSRPETVAGGAAMIGSELGVNALPYVVGGATLPLRAAALASGGMTTAQSMAGRDASTVGMLADITKSDKLGELADNPVGRVAADVGLDAALTFVSPAIRAMRGARGAAKAPLGLPPGQYDMGTGQPALALPSGGRVTPETDPSRLLPPTTDGLAGIGDANELAGPALPLPRANKQKKMTEPVTPEAPVPKTARSRKQAKMVVKPEGFAAPEIVGTLGGAAVGGAFGETPEERIRNSLIGAVGGGGAMSLGSRLDGLGLQNRPGKLDLRMTATHNMMDAHLPKWLKDEGIPAPSMAILPEDAPPFSQFANTSIIMKSHLTDPANVPMWKGDAYTPRLPYMKPERTARQLLEEMLSDHPGDWRGREGIHGMPSANTLSEMTIDSPKSFRVVAARPLKSKDELKSWASQNLPGGPEARSEGSTFDDLNARWGRATAKMRAMLKGAYGGQMSVPLSQQIWHDVAGIERYVQAGKLKPTERVQALQRSLGLHPDLLRAPELYDVFDEVFRVADDILEAPSGYAEAKPKRIISWDEVAGVHLPKKTSLDELLGEPASKDDLADFEATGGLPEEAITRKLLTEKGIPWTEYDFVPKGARSYPTGRAESAKDFRAELEKQGRTPFGFAAPEVVGTVAGAGAGGLVGGSQGETPEERTRNAILGMLAGGGVGYGGAKAVVGFPTPPLKVKGVPTRSAYESAVSSGKAGTPKKGAVMNPSLRALDPDGRRLWQLEELNLVAQGVSKQKVGDEEIEAFAKAIDVDDLAKSDVSKLDTAQLRALQNRIMEDRSEYGKLQDEWLKASPEEQAALDGVMESVLGRLVGYDRVLNRAASEQGRGLRILGQMAAKKGTFESALSAARSVLGTKVLGDEVITELRKVMRDPSLKTEKQRATALSQVIDRFNKQPLSQVILDQRRVGMLTAPATWAVNITGNVAERARQAITTPIAAAMDRAWSGLTGQQRSTTTAGRTQGAMSKVGALAGDVGQSVKGGTAWQDFKRGGFDAGNPLAELNRKRIDYVRDLKLSQQDGDELWRKSLRPGARILQTTSDIVYGMMNATDRPFFDAALGASLGERAALRAQREGLKGEALKQRIAELMLPENVDETDAAMALFDAAEDTFKTQTGFDELLRNAKPGAVKTGAQYFAPFVRTPSNLIRKAFEATPGLGLFFSEAQLKRRLNTAKDIKMTPDQLSGIKRRHRIRNAADQLTTGAGLITAGFMLSAAGTLSGEYVPTTGMDESEREASRKRGTRGQGALTLRVGKQSHSLASLGQFAPLLALGHALYMESDAEKGQGVVASLGEMGKTFATKPMQTMGRATAAAARTVTEFPMLQGAKNAIELLSGEKAGDFGTYLGREASTFIPAGSAVAAVGRAMDPIGPRKPEGFSEAIKERIPGLRESVPPKVGPMGETYGNVGPLDALFSPTRPQTVSSGPLYDALDKVEFYPTAPKKYGETVLPDGRRVPAETGAQHADRRQKEGKVERDLLTALMKYDEGAWSLVGDAAVEQFNQTGDWGVVLDAALSRQRSLLSRQRTDSLTQGAPQ